MHKQIDLTMTRKAMEIGNELMESRRITMEGRSKTELVLKLLIKVFHEIPNRKKGITEKNGNLTVELMGKDIQESLAAQ